MDGLRELLREKMRAQGAEAYAKFRCSEVIHDWSKIVDETIAEQVQPVKLEHGTLFVHVQNSAFKDQLKFVAEEIIEAINDHFGQDEPLVKEIKIAKAFQIADMPRQEGTKDNGQGTSQAFEEVTLTAEEVKACEAQAETFPVEELRPTVLATLLSQARAQKFRRAQGWHKCADCEALCPPEEIFCEVCKIKARSAMVEELYRIFYDEPWLKTRDAQKILLERMPNMRKECSPDVIESARTTLIQKVAGGIRYGDEDSPDVMKLVMLEKRLPPEKLTPAIIRRTLLDLQFNLSEGALLKRYDALKGRRRN